MRYLIVVEKTSTGYSAYFPDVPGCIATGSDQPEVEKAIHNAIEFHLDGMREDGHQVPSPTSYSTYVDVPA